jgi:hypothetical protein
MRQRGVSLSARHRAGIHGTVLLLLATGAGWMALKQWGQVAGEFGPEPHPWEPWLMKVHGAAALAFCVLLGTVLPVHARFGWRMRRNHTSGAGLVALSVFLILSGYLLYYAGGEVLRDVAARSHAWAGIALPFVVAGHVVLGRRSRSGR